MKLVVKTSWPELDYMPDRKTSSLQTKDGYQSVDQLDSGVILWTW